MLEELHRLDVAVTAVCARNDSPFARAARSAEAPLVVGEPVHEDTLREAGVEGALACGLLIDADLANLNVALELQQLAPQARIVVRLFNTSLVGAMRSLVRDMRVLSSTELAGGDEVQVVGTVLGLAELERRVAPPSDANECDETALGARILFTGARSP